MISGPHLVVKTTESEVEWFSVFPLPNPASVTERQQVRVFLCALVV